MTRMLCIEKEYYKHLMPKSYIFYVTGVKVTEVDVIHPESVFLNKT